MRDRPAAPFWFWGCLFVGNWSADDSDAEADTTMVCPIAPCCSSVPTIWASFAADWQISESDVATLDDAPPDVDDDVGAADLADDEPAEEPEESVDDDVDQDEPAQ